MQDANTMLKANMPDDRFVDSFGTALNLVNNAAAAHDEYWKMIDVCERHIRGEKPKNQHKLKVAGMAYSNNWNYHKARGKITKDVAENISRLKDAIFLGVPQFTRKESDGYEFLQSEDDRGIVSMKISRVFSETLFSENRFTEFMNRVEYPAYSYGFAAITFDGIDDWLGEPTHPRNIAFEDRTRPDDIQVFVTFDTLKANFLWRKWMAANNAKVDYITSEDRVNEADIRLNGWSAEGLASLLWLALKDDIKKEQGQREKWTNWDNVITDIRSNNGRISPSLIQNTHNVNIAKIYYKELNGKWTETYIPYGNEWQSYRSTSGTASTTSDKIIYQKDRDKVSQDKVIILVRDSGFAEGGFIAEQRGLAKFAVEDSIRFNRKKNNVEDKLILAGQPMFVKPNTQVGEKFKIVPSQGFTLVQTGFELLPEQPKFDLTQHLTSIQFDEQNYMRETVQYNPSIEGRLTSRPVKDEVRGLSAEVSRTRSAKSDVKISDYSKLLFNILHNLISVDTPKDDDIGREGYDYFYEELEYELRDYAPENADKSWYKGLIKLVKKYMIEEFAGDQESLTTAISMAETSYARNRLKRMLLVTQGFPRREIDRIAPLPSDTFRNLRDERVASYENDQAMNSSEIVITAEDDHIDHLGFHYRKVRRIMEAVQQGRLDPVMSFKWVTNIMTHAEAHLQLLSQDPTLQRQYTQLLQVHEELIRMLNELKQLAIRVQKQRQAESQQPEMSEKERRELAIKEFNAQKKEERTQALTFNQARMKAQQQQFDQRLKVQDQLVQQDLDKQAVDAEIELNKAKAVAESIS